MEPAPDPTSPPRQYLGAIALVVREYDEARDYYTRVLGFDLIEDIDQGHKRWVVVAPPGSSGTALLLARATTPEQAARIGDQTGGRVFLFLHTDDFRRDHARLRANGVVFEEEPRHEPYGIVAVFRDLYGNRWDLLQRVRGSDASATGLRSLVLALAGASCLCAGTTLAQSIDCTTAGDDVEQMICGDRGLSDLDIAVASAYQQAMARLRAPWLERDQIEWTRQLYACADADCARAALVERRGILNFLGYTSRDFSAAITVAGDYTTGYISETDNGPVRFSGDASVRPLSDITVSVNLTYVRSNLWLDNAAPWVCEFSGTGEIRDGVAVLRAHDDDQVWVRVRFSRGVFLVEAATQTMRVCGGNGGNSNIEGVAYEMRR